MLIDEPSAYGFQVPRTSFPFLSLVSPVRATRFISTILNASPVVEGVQSNYRIVFGQIKLIAITIIEFNIVQQL